MDDKHRLRMSAATASAAYFNTGMCQHTLRRRDLIAATSSYHCDDAKSLISVDFSFDATDST